MYFNDHVIRSLGKIRNIMFIVRVIGSQVQTLMLVYLFVKMEYVVMSSLPESYIIIPPALNIHLMRYKGTPDNDYLFQNTPSLNEYI